MPRQTKKSIEEDKHFIRRARVAAVAKMAGVASLSLNTVRQPVKYEIKADGAKNTTTYEHIMERLDLDMNRIISIAVAHAKADGRTTILCRDLNAALTMPAVKGRFFGGCEV